MIDYHGRHDKMINDKMIQHAWFRIEISIIMIDTNRFSKFCVPEMGSSNLYNKLVNGHIITKFPIVIIKFIDVYQFVEKKSLLNKPFTFKA